MGVYLPFWNPVSIGLSFFHFNSQTQCRKLECVKKKKRKLKRGLCKRVLFPSHPPHSEKAIPYSTSLLPTLHPSLSFHLHQGLIHRPVSSPGFTSQEPKVCGSTQPGCGEIGPLKETRLVCETAVFRGFRWDMRDGDDVWALLLCHQDDEKFHNQ